jgi:phage tail sheath protein FI
MGLFVTSPSSATLDGVYAIERTPPAVIAAQGTGVADIVGQFPWGPAQSLYTPSSVSDRLNRFAPPGMSRLGSGYLSMIQKGWPQLNVVRVVAASGVAAASAAINKTGPALLFTVNAQYQGAAGNSLVVTVGPASDGNSSHFKITVTVTGPSGTSQESEDNVDMTVNPFTVSGQTYDPTNNYLIGTIVQSSTGTPLAGNTAMTGGTDGSVASTDYVGTQGTANKGIALLEADKLCGRFFTDDPGNSLRSAVNAGVAAHALFKGDRVAFMNGPKGQAIADVATDVANYRGDKICYLDPWVYELDDTTGAQQLVPPASFAASVHAQLSPSTSIAWKSEEVVDEMLQGIRGLEVDRGDGAATNTANGVTTVISEPNGGFSFEGGVLTIAPQDPSRKAIERITIGIYIAKAFQSSIRGFVAGPNVTQNQENILDALTNFCTTLVQNAQTDANHLPHIISFDIPDISAFNTPDTIGGGDFYVPLDVRTSAAMHRIFLSFQFGPTVTTVTAS